MAKREIPEINAGSMADIAFLLLIFFLVTTTMDKDQALLRTIPKIIENPPEPEPVEKRNICLIKANNMNQLLFRGDFLQNPDDISEKVIEFYRTNEEQNDVTNNFPMYSTITKAEIEQNIVNLEAEIESIEAMPDYSEEVLKVKEEELMKWLEKKAAIELYGKNTLREVAFQAHVKIEVMKKTDYALLTKIHTEVQEAIHTMRNDMSMRLWNIPYSVIVKKVDGDPKNVEDKRRKELLKLLYNVQIIEVTPKS